jgi:CheY-like chemotaxis protein
VKQSGGHILVESEIRQGSTFRVLLPATSEAAEEPAEEVQPARVPAGRETVLVVEDEDSVRRMIAMALEQAGYVVEAVASPQEAIRWAGTAAGVDLVVTDVALPGMNGRQMAEVLSGMHPHAKVLFISGYTEDEVLRDRVRQDGLRFLQKPFLPKVLAAKVREMLDGR